MQDASGKIETVKRYSYGSENPVNTPGLMEQLLVSEGVDWIVILILANHISCDKACSCDKNQDHLNTNVNPLFQ